MYEKAMQRKLWRSDSLYLVSEFSFRIESWLMSNASSHFPHSASVMVSQTAVHVPLPVRQPLFTGTHV
jgi:hypothetical protein